MTRAAWLPGILVSMVCAAPCIAQEARPLVLVGGTILTGTSTAPISDAAIVMRGDTIVAMGPRSTVAIPDDADVRDVSGATIVPGLIDGHVHIGIGPFIGNSTPFTDVLGSALAHGVTTIVDLGDAHSWILALRDSVRSGAIRGPRIFAAGAVVTAPGGHPAGTFLRASAEAASMGTRQVATPDEARTAVAGLISDGVDVVKVVFDGGSERSPFGLLPRLDSLGLIAAVSAARAGDRPSHVHWQNARELAGVLAAQPDVLVHSSVGPMPAALIEAIASSNAIVQPTAIVMARVLPAQVYEQLYLSNISAMVRAGVRIAAGTDAPLSGDIGPTLLDELDLLVRAGLTPAQAMEAATVHAAAALGRTDIGRLAVGARADILVLADNPYERLNALRNVRMVVAQGRVVTP